MIKIKKRPILIYTTDTTYDKPIDYMTAANSAQDRGIMAPTGACGAAPSRAWNVARGAPAARDVG